MADVVLVEQPTAAPVRKVKLAAIVGTVITVALAVVDASEAVKLPAWLVGPATLIGTIGTAYLARSAAAEG